MGNSRLGAVPCGTSPQVTGHGWLYLDRWGYSSRRAGATAPLGGGGCPIVLGTPGGENRALCLPAAVGPLIWALPSFACLSRPSCTARWCPPSCALPADGEAVGLGWVSGSSSCRAVTCPRCRGAERWPGVSREGKELQLEVWAPCSLVMGGSCQLGHQGHQRTTDRMAQGSHLCPHSVFRTTRPAAVPPAWSLKCRECGAATSSALTAQRWHTSVTAGWGRHRAHT